MITSKVNSEKQVSGAPKKLCRSVSAMVSPGACNAMVQMGRSGRNSLLFGAELRAKQNPPLAYVRSREAFEKSYTQ